MVNTRKVLSRTLLLLIVVTVLLLTAGTVFADKDFVVDQADLFSDADEAALQAQAASLGSEYAMDVVIVTTNNAEGKSSMAYADDFFDYNGYGVGENFDGLLMLIDMDNRQVWISTSGKAIDIFTDARIEGILDDIFAGDKMANGDYTGAARSFLKSTGSILLGNTLTPAEALISLLASGGVGASVFGGVRGKYKGRNTRPVFEYQKNSLVNYGIVTDNLFNTYVTQRVIPRPTSTGGGRGGSSTHTSSSGRSHGGGGRGF